MSTKVIEQDKENKSIIKTIVLILIVIALVLLPLLIVKDGEFGGADGEAEVAITEINKDYEPWYSPLIEPKSGEIESLLFVLQAVIGSGIVFYVLGYMRGRKKREETNSNDIH